MKRLTEAQLKSLKDFKEKRGRFWKRDLKNCWDNSNHYLKYFGTKYFNNDDVARLQQIRNLGVNLNNINL